MRTRLPAPTFTSPLLDVVWASLAALQPEELLELEVELRRRLALGDLPSTRVESRVADALSALRAAAETLGHSPSVREYEELRRDRRELELPASSSVRTRLAGGWNDCLRRARLAAVPDGDLPVSTQFRFDEPTAVAALQECARDLGDAPTQFTYRVWARRPDVAARPGRRPLAETVYFRLFGSWSAALSAAGLFADAVKRRDGRIDPGECTYEDEELKVALRLVHDRLGYSPSLAEYNSTRKLIRAEWELQGELRTLPAASTIAHRWRIWADALAAAGLPKRRMRKGLKPGPKEPVYGDDDVLAALRHAYREVGEPFTQRAYQSWRDRQRLVLADGSKTPPSAWLASTRFGGWNSAVTRALTLEPHAAAPEAGSHHVQAPSSATEPDQARVALDDFTVATAVGPSPEGR